MMKNQLVKFGFLFFGLGALALTSCKKDVDPEENEEELITTMRLTFTPASGGAAMVFEFDDPDGPGGNNPTIDDIALSANTTYNVAVQLLNNSETPAEDITLEVDAESEAHRFYYEPSAGSNITVSNLNNDAVGLPLGITSTWTTMAAANGTVKVTLRHYPGNPPNKAANDPVTSNKSSTDIEVTFNTQVQ